LYLKRLDERPEKSADALPSTEQLDETHDSEQAEKVDADDGLAGLQTNAKQNHISNNQHPKHQNYHLHSRHKQKEKQLTLTTMGSWGSPPTPENEKTNKQKCCNMLYNKQ
jgi:hypothetical protein